MTRKTALKEAIRAIKKANISQNKKEQITKKLNLCISELPYAKWTKEAIFDACDQFIAEHGQPLRLKDFQSRELPSHPTVKNRFGMTLKEFRDTYYPLPEKKKIAQISEETIRDFREEYCRCGATNMESYNKRRSEGTPCAKTVIRRAGASGWCDLLARAGLSSQLSPHKDTEAYALTMHFAYEEKLSAMEADKEAV